jgi:hypothetical protein
LRQNPKAVRAKHSFSKTYLYVAYVGALLTLFTFSLRNSSRLGPTWDDWYYPESLAKQLRIGAFNFSGDYASFASGYGLGSITFLDFASRFLTLDFSSEIETNLHALFLRRVIQIILTFSAGYVLVSVLKSLGFEKRIAWFAPLLLLSLPNWIGQGEINVKDIPVAVGLLFIVDSFFRIIDSRTTKKRCIYATLEGILGIHLSFGTRFGLFIFILISTMWIFVFGKLHEGRTFKFVYKKILSILLLGYLFLIPLNPILLNPFKVAYYSVFGTLSLFNLPAGPVLTANQLIDGNSPPYWYLPAWTLVQMPVTHSILLLGGVILFAGSFRNTIGNKSENKDRSLNQLKLLVFATLTIGPYIAASIVRPPLYDGDRQFLMAYPFLVFLMLTAVQGIFAKFELVKSKIIWTALTLSILISPGFSMIQVEPFTYSFRNEMVAKPSQWEGDYSGVSIRLAVSQFVSKEDKLAFDFSDERWLVTVNRKETFNQSTKTKSGYVFVASRRGVRQTIPPECKPLEGIKTKVFGRENILTFVAICPREDMRKK